MGMYTEFVFGCMLKENTPKEVINVLEYLCNSDNDEFDDVSINHEFFNCHRWQMIGSCSSYYFGAPSHSVCEKDRHYNNYRLSIRCNLKNYSGEIKKFVDWIKPYIEQGAGNSDLLGYAIYEESDKPEMFYLYDPDRESF